MIRDAASPIAQAVIEAEHTQLAEATETIVAAASMAVEAKFDEMLIGDAFVNAVHQAVTQAVTPLVRGLRPPAAPRPRAAASTGTATRGARGAVSAREAAQKVLRAARNRPLHTKVITERVLATPGVSMKGATPEASIAAMLATENAKGGIFVKTAPGTYKLR